MSTIRRIKAWTAKQAPFGHHQKGYCLLCRGPSEQAWCHNCHQDMRYLGPVCQCCAIPLPTTGICGNCTIDRPLYTHCHFLYLYRYPCQLIITNYKYHARIGLANSLAYYFSELISHAGNDLPEAVLAIPLHWKKQMARGFNQSIALAKRLAYLLNIPFIPNAINATRATQAQASLPNKRRKANVRHAFQIKTPLHYRHVALVDDVMTTGATVNEVARLLSRQGIKKTAVWVIARTNIISDHHIN